MNTDEVQQIRYEQREPTPAHVKLRRFVRPCEHLPVLRQLVPVHVGELADLPDTGRKFARQEFKDAPTLTFTYHHGDRDVVEMSAVSRAVELYGKATPSLELSFLTLGFERHGVCEPNVRGRRSERD